MAKISRNSPCPCGSGKKYKQCCGKVESTAMRAAAQPKSAIGGEFQQAVMHFKKGNLKGAEVICDRLLAADPQNLEALKMGGLIALQTTQWQKAKDILDRQARLMPNDPIARSNLGMALFELGLDDEAHASNRAALRMAPNMAEAHNNIGKILERRHQLREAGESYQKAIINGKGNPHYTINRAAVLDAMGEHAEAESLYRGVVKQYPGFPPAHNNLALLLMKQGALDEAKEQFDVVLKAEPNNPEVHNNLGSLMLEREEFDRAESCFKKARALDPQNSNALTNLGLLYDQSGRDDESRDCYQLAMELDPDNPNLQVNLGLQLHQLGEHDSAVEHLERALQLNPNHVEALSCLGEILLEQWRVDKAAELIEKAMQLGGEDYSAGCAIALLREAQSRLADAESAWRRVIEIDPSRDRGAIGLAKLLITQDRSEEARQVYQQAQTGGLVSVNFYLSWSRFEEHAHNLEEASRIATMAADSSPGSLPVTIFRSTLARRNKDFQAAIEILDEMKLEGLRSNRLKADFLFEKGTVLDKLGQFSEAFAAFDSANSYKNRYTGVEYEKAEDERQYAVLAEVFTEDYCRQFAALAAELPETDITPVFIVGFPRSGTTLLEQILGAHGEMEPAGELPYILDLAHGECSQQLGSSLPYPECLIDQERSLTTADLLQLRETYLTRMKRHRVTQEGVRWVVDKMPHNALFIGLIALLFPKSPIIHISRHPLDSCLSAYFSNFTGHRYTSSLESTATHYQHMMDCIEHFRSVLTMRFIDIRYQDLVDDQASVVGRLLDFIGAEWDESCMQHHKKSRLVQTVSYEQVTQEVYRTSLARYLGYWDSVQNCIPIIQPSLDRFDYPLK